MTDQIPVTIQTPHIKLDSFLKHACLVSTGGEAKHQIQSGLVQVNHGICTERGKKLYVDDIVSYEGKEYIVCKSGDKTH